MKELQIFENPEFGEIRTIEIDGEVWFVGKDVAEILGYSDTAKAIRTHVDEEDKGVDVLDTPGGNQNLIIINESGLYSLVLSSKMPKAKEFKRWVTSKVLPSIRKHGMYATDELLNNPEFAIQVFQKLKEEQEKSKLLELKAQEQAKQIETNKPKVIFADSVAAADTSILVGELAKILKQNGIDIGQNRLFAILRDKGYLIKSGSQKNLPTQRSMELGLFTIKESTVNNPDGSIRITRTPKVTGKGQIYFINMFMDLQMVEGV